MPTVSGMSNLSMPASETALTTCLKNWISVRVASSAENSTLTPKPLA